MPKKILEVRGQKAFANYDASGMPDGTYVFVLYDPDDPRPMYEKQEFRPVPVIPGKFEERMLVVYPVDENSTNHVQRQMPVIDVEAFASEMAKAVHA